MTERHFIACTNISMSVIRLSAECDQEFDYNIFFYTLWSTHFGSLVPMILMVTIGVCEAVHRCGKSRIASKYLNFLVWIKLKIYLFIFTAVCYAFALVLCITFGFLFHDNQVIWTVGAIQGLLATSIGALTALTIEYYKTSQRCSMLGLLTCCGHIGALIGTPLFAVLPVSSCTAAATIGTLSLLIPLISSILLKDPSSLI